jgi:radical SAM protein with 4Fe4S-binding SPASM domain
MPAFLATLGVKRFAMNLFIPTAAAPASAELFLSYGAIGPVVDAVAAAARAAGLTFYWYSPTPFADFNPIARGLGNKSCAAADGLLSVAPDGAVLPCSSWNEPLGYLLKDDFRTLWYGEQAAWYQAKNFAPEYCRPCPSFVACQGACPLYWRYAGAAAPAADRRCAGRVG